MGVLDKFEKGVERVVSTAFAKAFRSEVKPVELASALRREVDDRAAVVGPRPHRGAQRVHHRAVARRPRSRSRTGAPSRSPTSSRRTSPSTRPSSATRSSGRSPSRFVRERRARDRPLPGAQRDRARRRRPGDRASPRAHATPWWTSTASATCSPARSPSSAAAARPTSSSTTRASPGATSRSASRRTASIATRPRLHQRHLRRGPPGPGRDPRRRQHASPSGAPGSCSGPGADDDEDR